MKRNYEKIINEYNNKFLEKGIFHVSDYQYIATHGGDLFELINLALTIGFMTGYRRANADRYRRNKRNQR